MRPFQRREGPLYVARVLAGEREVLLDVVDGVVALLLDTSAETHTDGSAGSAGSAGLGGSGGSAGSVPRASEGDPADPWDRLRLGSGPVAAPQDPALRRLLPDAADDADLAAELRRLTEADLRLTKVDHLRCLRAVLAAATPDVVVVPSDAPAVAAALTDVRLVLASRLGVLTDDDAERVYALALQDQPATSQGEAEGRFVATVYAVLTELQESLVQLMIQGLAPGDTAREV